MSSARSTAYHVELTERALNDLEAIYAEVDGGNSEAAYAWYNGLERIIFSLDSSPERGVRTRKTVLCGRISMAISLMSIE